MNRFTEAAVCRKIAEGFRQIRSLHITTYAGYASYFLILSLFPGLVLILGLLRFAGLGGENLLALIEGFIPQVLLPTVRSIVRLTYQNTTGTVLSLSAAAALWSASRGIYGLIWGLNAVYGGPETRSYLRRRGVSIRYTFGFLLVLLLTLGLHVFGERFLGAYARELLPLLLLAVQTLLFAAMFRGLPDRDGGFRESLPGAILGALGWLVFTDLYSVYIRRFARLTNVYGSVYAVALSMLWLYCCVSIVFYGALLNRLLAERKSVNNL